MLILVHVTYGPQYGNSTSVNNTNSDYTGWAFNTDTFLIEPVRGTWSGTFLQTKPADVYYPDGTPIYYDCDRFVPGSDQTNFSATVYYYQRAGERVTSGREDDCIYCGWEPADTRSCRLLISSIDVSYDQATINCQDVVGPLQYSLDGGNNRQSSNIFRELSPSQYEATVYDLGATQKGCQQKRKFVVSDAAPSQDVAHVQPLPVFCFAGNPVMVSIEAAVALHQVLVQVWVESVHRSGSYALAFESKRRSNSQAQVQLDVQDVLRAQLENTLDISERTRVLGSACKNWFVRVADVLPQNGKPGNWVNSTSSLVMLGGLAPEPLLAGADYWHQARLSRLFHTWQPITKRVGPEHLEVLQFLQPDAEAYQVRVKWFNAQGVAMPTRVYDLPPLLDPVPAQNAVLPPEPVAEQLVRFCQVQLYVLEFIGAAQLHVDVIAAGDVAGLDGAESLSYTRVLDVATTSTPRQLIYHNSLGGHDTLAFFGKIAGKLTTGGQDVEAYVSNQATRATTRLTKSYPGTPTTPSYTLSTGWLAADWLEYLQELVQPGRDVYEFAHGRLRPVVLTTKELATYQETDSMAAAVIEYKPALINEYYSDYARNTNQSATVGAGW